MYKSRRTRNGLIAILAIGVMIAVYIGCDRHNKTGVLTPATTDNYPNEQTPDWGYTDEITVLSPETERYSAVNESEFSKVLQSGEVQYAIGKFESLEYSLDLTSSVIMTGSGVPYWPGAPNDTIEVKIINLILRYLPDSTSNFIWIACISSPNHPDLPSYISASALYFIVPDGNLNEYEAIEIGADEYGADRYIWIKDFVLPFDPKGNDGSLATWSWKKWGSCTAIGTAAGCVTSAIGCAASGPGYLGCLGAWCGGSVVGSAVACAISQWF